MQEHREFFSLCHLKSLFSSAACVEGMDNQCTPRLCALSISAKCIIRGSISNPVSMDGEFSGFHPHPDPLFLTWHCGISKQKICFYWDFVSRVGICLQGVIGRSRVSLYSFIKFRASAGLKAEYINRMFPESRNKVL